MSSKTEKKNILLETEDDKIKFRLVWPDKEIVIEQALQDEVDYFNSQTKALPKLLTVLSY